MLARRRREEASPAPPAAAVLPGPRVVGADADETGALAAALGDAIRRQVRELARQFKEPEAAAASREREYAQGATERLALADPDEDVPAEQLTWWRLSAIGRESPARAQALWARVKAEAVERWQSGHTAARAIEEPAGDLWQRAQFLAVRQAFLDDWQPRGGTELALIDAMAQSYTAYLLWLTRATFTAYTDERRMQQTRELYGGWEPPREDAAATVERTAEMADRFHRMFLRNVRALRDLRRYGAPAVVVQHAGQVNVGQQQVNLHGPPDTAE